MTTEFKMMDYNSTNLLFSHCTTLLMGIFNSLVSLYPWQTLSPSVTIRSGGNCFICRASCLKQPTHWLCMISLGSTGLPLSPPPIIKTDFSSGIALAAKGAANSVAKKLRRFIYHLFRLYGLYMDDHSSNNLNI